MCDEKWTYMCVLSSIKINTDNFTQCDVSILNLNISWEVLIKEEKHLLVSYPFIIKASLLWAMKYVSFDWPQKYNEADEQVFVGKYIPKMYSKGRLILT